MNDALVIHNFPITAVPGRKYRFIRLRQTEKNHQGNDYLVISSLEIFGTRYECDSSEGKELSYNAAKPLDGIIADMTRECGGNVAKKGVVNIIGSTNRIVAENVASIGSDSLWISQQAPNTSIGYDFKDRRIIPTGYTIRTGPVRGEYCEEHHPKSWVFEVSNDRITWDIVGRHDNNEDIEGSYATCKFPISPQPTESFRFIRLCMTGKNHADVDGCILSSLEVFGNLISTK